MWVIADVGGCCGGPAGVRPVGNRPARVRNFEARNLTRRRSTRPEGRHPRDGAATNGPWLLARGPAHVDVVARGTARASTTEIDERPKRDAEPAKRVSPVDLLTSGDGQMIRTLRALRPESVSPSDEIPRSEESGRGIEGGGDVPDRMSRCLRPLPSPAACHRCDAVAARTACASRSPPHRARVSDVDVPRRRLHSPRPLVARQIRPRPHAGRDARRMSFAAVIARFLEGSIADASRWKTERRVRSPAEGDEQREIRDDVPTRVCEDSGHLTLLLAIGRLDRAERA